MARVYIIARERCQGASSSVVAIARALINDPDILFADEPTANLDSSSSRQILELFQKLNREINLTIMMVTHEPEDRKYVSRVIWLKDGELAEKEGISGSENLQITKD